MTELTELIAANETMRQTIEALAADPDLMTFMARVLEIVSKQVGAPLVEYFSHDGPTTARLRLSCRDGVVMTGSDVPNDFRVRGITIPRAWMGAADTVFGREDYYITESLLLDPISVALCMENGFDLVAFCEARGVGKLLNVALPVGDISFGALVFHVPVTHELGPSTIALLEVIGRQVALALRLTELGNDSRQAAVTREQERASRERAAELGEVNDQLQENLLRLAEGGDEHATLGELLRSALKQLRAVGAAVHRHADPTDAMTVIASVAARSPLGCLLDWPFSARDARVDASIPISKCANVVVDAREAADAASFLPGAAERWIAEGAPVLFLLPIGVGSRLLGWMILAFPPETTAAGVSAESRRVGQSLASLAAMTMETSRLARRAQDAALAEERERLAGELHDTLAGALTGISVHLRATASLAGSKSNAVGRREASILHAQELARDGLRQVREFVSSLTLGDPDPPLALEALRELVTMRTAGTDTRGVFETEGHERPLKPGIAHALLRVAQESVGNAQRYADASEIAVKLRFEDAAVVLVVRDDGRGFDVDRARDVGVGITSIAGRAARLGGAHSIDSASGRGTTITVTLPMPYAEERPGPQR